MNSTIRGHGKIPAKPAEQRLVDEDDLNRGFIKFLEIDSRMAFSEIAATLKVSKGTIRNRVNRMKTAGVLRITAVIDPTGVEYRPSAMLSVKVEKGYTPQDVANRLGMQSNVGYILWVAVRYDLIVENHDALFDFLEIHIFMPEDIAESEVLPGLKNFKKINSCCKVTGMISHHLQPSKSTTATSRKPNCDAGLN